MKSTSIILDGYLNKKKKDASKASLNKYQRRWFELTPDTLAYAKDPVQLKDGSGKVEVFGIHELVYIKKIDDNKLEMKFPERVLRVKGDTTSDAQTWFTAVDKAYNARLQGVQASKEMKLEALQKSQLTKLHTEAENDDDNMRNLPAARPPTPPKPSQSGIPERPPSPRSLLANPRMGNMILANTPATANQHDDEYDEYNRRYQQQQQQQQRQHYEQEYEPPGKMATQSRREPEAARNVRKQEERITLDPPPPAAGPQQYQQYQQQPSMPRPQGLAERLVLDEAGPPSSAASSRASSGHGSSYGRSASRADERLVLADQPRPSSGARAGGQTAASRVPATAAAAAAAASGRATYGNERLELGSGAAASSRGGSAGSNGVGKLATVPAAAVAAANGQDHLEEDWDSSDGEEASPPAPRGSGGSQPASVSHAVRSNAAAAAVRLGGVSDEEHGSSGAGRARAAAAAAPPVRAAAGAKQGAAKKLQLASEDGSGDERRGNGAGQGEKGWLEENWDSDDD